MFSNRMNGDELHMLLDLPWFTPFFASPFPMVQWFRPWPGGACAGLCLAQWPRRCLLSICFTTEQVDDRSLGDAEWVAANLGILLAIKSGRLSINKTGLATE